MKQFPQKQLDNYLRGLIDSLIEIYCCLEEGVKIQIMIQQRNISNSKYKIDVQKYYQELKFTTEQYNQILPKVLEFPAQKIQTNRFDYLRGDFQIQIKRNCSNINLYTQTLEQYYQLYQCRIIDIENEILQLLPKQQEISENIPYMLQREYTMQYKLMEYLTKQFQKEIENGYDQLRKYKVNDAFEILLNLQEGLRKERRYSDSRYQSLYIKIKLQIQLLRFIKGDKVISQKYEYFLFDLNTCDLKFEGYFNKHLKQNNWGQVNAIDDYVLLLQRVEHSIHKGMLKDQLTTFFKNDEIQKLMRETQDELGIPQDTSLNFIRLIKFSANPQENIICETIKNIAIIINIHSLIQTFKDKIYLPEFQKVLMGYSIVMTIHGWTQFQLIKQENKKHIIYEGNLDQQDKQFLLYHKIFGITENKSNLKFINHVIAQKIADTTQVKFLQKYLLVRQEPPIERTNFIF